MSPVFTTGPTNLLYRIAGERAPTAKKDRLNENPHTIIASTFLRIASCASGTNSTSHSEPRMYG